MTFSPEVTNGLFALGGGVAGAIVAGISAVYASRSSRDKKEIVVSTSNPSRLLVVHNRIASDVEIRVSGHKVDNVLLSDIFLSNTGNKAIENLDFPVHCQPECTILSIDALGQATDSPRTGTNIVMINKQWFSVAIEYINPGEELALRCMVSANTPEWKFALRQPELAVIVRDRPVASHSDVLAEVFAETLSSMPLLRTYLRLVSPAFKRFLDGR
jgi:hypothetical protein